MMSLPFFWLKGKLDSITTFSLYLFILIPYRFESIFVQQVSDFDLFTLDDVDSAFQNIVRLKYSQNYLLNGR
jgi:Cft2 family RNA processing exonuclease